MAMKRDERTSQLGSLVMAMKWDERTWQLGVRHRLLAYCHTCVLNNALPVFLLPEFNISYYLHLNDEHREERQDLSIHGGGQGDDEVTERVYFLEISLIFVRSSQPRHRHP